MIVGFSFHVLTGVFGFDAPHKEQFRNEVNNEQIRNGKEFQWKSRRKGENEGFIDSFLNRMKRMNSTPIQPICNKEEALKRYRTVF